MSKIIPRKLRIEILERDKWKCRLCSRKHQKMLPLFVHHKNEIRSDNRKTNLITLCMNCHKKWHSLRSHWDYFVKSGSFPIKTILRLFEGHKGKHYLATL